MMEGDVVCGIFLATYGEFATSTFDTWRRSNLRDWTSEGMGPEPFTYEVDLDPRSWGAAPALGGSDCDVNPKGSRITGIRVLPPSGDVHAYKTKRAGEIRECATSDNVTKTSRATTTETQGVTNLREPHIRGRGKTSRAANDKHIAKKRPPRKTLAFSPDAERSRPPTMRNLPSQHQRRHRLQNTHR